MAGQKLAVCALSSVPLRQEPSDQSEMVSQILAGEPVNVLEEVKKYWIKIECLEDGYIGYADPRHFISPAKSGESCMVVYDDQSVWTSDAGMQCHIFSAGSAFTIANGRCFIGEKEFTRITPPGPKPSTLCDTAVKYLGTPYLWGGRSRTGIDCSGLVQISAKVLGIQLPRDAKDQAETGNSVAFEERKANDLAYFSNDAGKITHVAILLNSDTVIHASGEVRIDGLNEEGIIHSDSQELTHNLHSIRRISHR